MSSFFCSWPSLTNGPRETALSSSTPAVLSPMIRSLLRLWCHESTRTYGDRLLTEEQRHWFSSLLHKTVEEFFCRDNSNMFSVEQAEIQQGWICPALYCLLSAYLLSLCMDFVLENFHCPCT